MPSITLSAGNARDAPDSDTPASVVGGTGALADSDDGTYVDLVSTGSTASGLIVDFAPDEALPAGAVATRYTLNARVSSPAGVTYSLDVSEHLDTGDFEPYFFGDSDAVDATAATDLTISHSSHGADPLTPEDVAAGLVQAMIYAVHSSPYASGGTLRIYELSLTVEYAFTAAENIFNLSQTRSLEYDRQDAVDVAQPWSTLASEGTHPVTGEDVITGQFSAQTTDFDNYYAALGSYTAYDYNTQTVGDDRVFASIAVRRFQSEPDPLPRTVRLRIVADWRNTAATVLSAGGSWDIHVLATTAFTPNLADAGADVSSYWLAPGDLGDWTVMATVTAVGSLTSTDFDPPDWAADYIDSGAELFTAGTATFDGLPYVDVEFEWSGAGNLAVAVVDDYWLSGTAPSFPLGDQEFDQSIRTQSAMVDLWVHTAASAGAVTPRWPLRMRQRSW